MYPPFLFKFYDPYLKKFHYVNFPNIIYVPRKKGNLLKIKKRTFLGKVRIFELVII